MTSYVITGASRGLGYSFIKKLSTNNPTSVVVGLVRNKAATDKKVADDGLTSTNLHILEVPDITDYSALLAAAKIVDELTHGKGLDVLVHNAARVVEEPDFSGVAFAEKDVHAAAKEFSKHFETNVNGVLLTTTAFLPLIRKSKIKKVVAITSGMADADLVAQFEVTNGAAYSTSKAALNVLVAKYHASYGNTEGILFFGISPGVVNTAETAKDYTPAELAGLGKMIAKFQESSPDWKGLITPKQSVDMIIKLVERASVKEFGGAFVNFVGNKEWLQNPDE